MPWGSIPADAFNDSFTLPSDFVAMPMSQNPLWDIAQPFEDMGYSPSYEAYNDQYKEDGHLEGRNEVTQSHVCHNCRTDIVA